MDGLDQGAYILFVLRDVVASGHQDHFDHLIASAVPCPSGRLYS